MRGYQSNCFDLFLFIHVMHYVAMSIIGYEN